MTETELETELSKVQSTVQADETDITQHLAAYGVVLVVGIVLGFALGHYIHF